MQRTEITRLLKYLLFCKLTCSRPVIPSSLYHHFKKQNFVTDNCDAYHIESQNSEPILGSIRRPIIFLHHLPNFILQQIIITKYSSNQGFHRVPSATRTSGRIPREDHSIFLEAWREGSYSGSAALQEYSKEDIISHTMPPANSPVSSVNLTISWTDQRGSEFNG